MSTMVKIDRTLTAAAGEVATGINMIRNGIGKLSGLNGLRDQSIAVSAAEMQANFGIETSAQATAFSDKWAAFLTAYEAGEGGDLDKLAVLIDAVAI